VSPAKVTKQEKHMGGGGPERVRRGNRRESFKEDEPQESIGGFAAEQAV
jgi:hypothetical protein